MTRTSNVGGHDHSISNPNSGYTDPGPDGHTHRLTRGCLCNKIRNLFRYNQLLTTTDFNHHHTYDTRQLRQLVKPSDK